MPRAIDGLLNKGWHSGKFEELEWQRNEAIMRAGLKP
jgi:hypothetical protein